MSKEAVEALVDDLFNKYGVPDSERATIRAALQQQEGQGWQSIETAPKDRSWMLGACSGSRVVLMAWNDTLNFWEDLGGFEVAPPTHWMPLPTPPEPGA